ncbi:MAG: hypothetical protein U5R30_09555 [Deltaproteobacteria bacterium]|nr:hypothetical protein [Deltaproteobacteria bacterium]
MIARIADVLPSLPQRLKSRISGCEYDLDLFIVGEQRRDENQRPRRRAVYRSKKDDIDLLFPAMRDAFPTALPAGATPIPSALSASPRTSLNSRSSSTMRIIGRFSGVAMLLGPWQRDADCRSHIFVTVDLNSAVHLHQQLAGDHQTEPGT